MYVHIWVLIQNAKIFHFPARAAFHCDRRQGEDCLKYAPLKEKKLCQLEVLCYVLIAVSVARENCRSGEKFDVGSVKEFPSPANSLELAAQDKGTSNFEPSP